MNTPERYVRYTTSLSSSGKIIPEIELKQLIQNSIEERIEGEAYTSLYYFSKDAVDYYNNHSTIKGNSGSMSGYDGPAKIDHLVFDLDSENLLQALEDGRDLIQNLFDHGFYEDSVSVFFSGNKGFHIKAKISEELTPEQLKNICSEVAKNISTFDERIYNTTRIFRIENSRHLKTGLYKVEIPLLMFQDASLEKIKEWAKEPREVLNHEPSLLPDNLLKLTRTTNQTTFNNPVLIKNINELDFSKKPFDMPYCKYAILNGFFLEGSRNDCLLSMAAYFKNQGYPKEVTFQNLLGIIEVQENRFPTKKPYTRQEVWDTIVEYVYSPNYKNGIPNCKTNDSLKEVCIATGLHDDCVGKSKESLGIQTIEQLDNSYNNFITHIDKNLIKTGIDFIDRNTKLIKGTSNYICGRSGSGKTTLILNTLRNTNKNGINSIFFSADTSAVIIYQRMVASVTGLTQNEVEETYKSGNKTKIAEFKKLVDKEYGKTTFNIKSSLTLDIIKDSIKRVEDQTSSQMDLVIIDYNERVMNQFSDPMNSVRHTALNLVDLSAQLNKCFITIAQVSRTKGSERTPLLSKNAAKESGAVEESANMLMTIWRPLYGVGGDDNYMGVCIPKNRMGREGITTFLKFDGDRSLVRDCSASELADCKYKIDVLDKKEAEENSENDNRFHY